jgi:hypothetical protein
MHKLSGINKRQKVRHVSANVLRHELPVLFSLPDIEEQPVSTAALDGEEDTTPLPAIQVKAKAKRYVNSVRCMSSVAKGDPNYIQDQPLRSWIPCRKEYGAILMQRHGRGVLQGQPCPTCPRNSQNIDPEFRCSDCFGGRLLCQDCMVRVHEHSPLHHIEVRSCVT